MVVKLAEEKRALERFVFSLASYHKVTQVFDFCKGMNVIELNYHDMMGISSLKKATLKCIFMQLLLGNHHESSISDAAFGGYFSCTGTEEGWRKCPSKWLPCFLCQNLSSKHNIKYLI